LCEIIGHELPQGAIFALYPPQLPDSPSFSKNPPSPRLWRAGTPSRQRGLPDLNIPYPNGTFKRFFAAPHGGCSQHKYESGTARRMPPKETKSGKILPGIRGIREQKAAEGRPSMNLLLKMEPPRPCPLLHKCVDDRKMDSESV
jgi:hypothetical protein